MSVCHNSLQKSKIRDTPEIEFRLLYQNLVFSVVSVIQDIILLPALILELTGHCTFNSKLLLIFEYFYIVVL